MPGSVQFFDDKSATPASVQPHVLHLDHDPVALAWARVKVLEVTGRWRTLAARLAADDMDANAEKWRRICVIVENALIGGKTEELGAFDERKGEKNG